MRPEDVGQVSGQLVLGRHSGRHAVQRRCDTLTLNVTAVEIEHVYRAVIAFVGTRTAVGDGDLRRIVERLRASGGVAKDDASAGSAHVEAFGYGHGV